MPKPRLESEPLPTGKRESGAIAPIEAAIFGEGAQIEAGLHLVATPIGNSADITLRALRVLRQADIVACEDTRVSAKLLHLYGIQAETLAYHEHNADRMRPQLLARLARGERIALISDAGTPLVSDPGYKLVREAVAAGAAVHVLPGPSAPLAALLLSGLPSDRFLFMGFLDSRSSPRRRELAEAAELRATLIFFESAQRLADSLADMAAVLGDRPAAVTRELTKYYEEVRRDSLAALAAHYIEAGPPKGEIVVVVGPPLPDAKPAAADLDAVLAEAMTRLSLKDAATTVAATLGLKRREVYGRAVELAARQSAKVQDSGE